MTWEPRSVWEFDDPRQVVPPDVKITRRDYFAAQALAPLLREFGARPSSAKLIAELAYDLADAMLDARDKQPTRKQSAPHEARGTDDDTQRERQR